MLVVQSSWTLSLCDCSRSRPSSPSSSCCGSSGDCNGNMSKDIEVLRHDMDMILLPLESPGQGLPRRQGQDLGSHQQSHRRRLQGKRKNLCKCRAPAIKGLWIILL